MTDFFVIAFVIAHGVVHAAVWATPKDPDKPAPFDPSHSWALAAGHVAAAPTRSASVVLAWVSAVLYTLAGVSVAVDAANWMVLATLAAIVGLALKGVWFNRWLSLGVLLDVAVLVAVAQGWPPSVAG
jgi:hypothetical protein